MKIRPVGADLFLVDSWTDRPPGGRTQDTTKLEVPFHIFTNPPKRTANYAVSDAVCRLNQEVLYCQNSCRFTVHVEMKLNLHSFLRRFSSNSQMLDVISRRPTTNFTERSVYVQDKIYLPH